MKRFTQFMGWLCAAGCLLTANPSIADDEPEIPTPEAVLESAARSRFDFIDTLIEVRALIPRIAASPEELRAFLDILPKLKALEVSLAFSVFEESPLADVALALARSATTKIDLCKDRKSVVEAVIDFGNDDVRYSFATAQNERIAAVTEPRPLVDCFWNVTAAVGRAGAQPNANVFVTQTFAALQGAAFTQLLRFHRSVIPREEFAQLSGELVGAIAINPALLHVHRGAMISTDPAFLREVVFFTLLLNNRLRNTGETLSQEIDSRPGQIIADTLWKIVQVSGDLPIGPMNLALQLMDAIQIEQLGVRLSDLNLNLLRSSQFQFLATLGGEMAGRARQLGLLYEASRIETLLARVNLVLAMNTKSPEGVFEIRIGREPAIMTVLRTGAADVSVGISTTYLNWGMSYATYDRAVERVVVTRYAAGSIMSEMNYFIGFQVEAEGAISGTFDNGVQIKRFVGRKIVELPDFLSTATEDDEPSSVLGLFEGVVMGKPFALEVRRGAGNLVALGTFHRGDVYFVGVHLPSVYYNSRRKVLYATDREPLEGGAIVQVRAELVGDELIGAYIVSGRPGFYPLRLKRTEAR